MLYIDREFAYPLVGVFAGLGSCLFFKDISGKKEWVEFYIEMPTTFFIYIFSSSWCYCCDCWDVFFCYEHLPELRIWHCNIDQLGNLLISLDGETISAVLTRRCNWRDRGPEFYLYPLREPHGNGKGHPHLWCAISLFKHNIPSLTSRHDTWWRRHYQALTC
jgi:hypothetical protein